MKKISLVVLGVIVAIGGLALAQSFTEFLNIRVYDGLDLQGDLFDATGSVTVNDDLTATSFAGDGAALTGLSASNISAGTLTDARLSSNVALYNGSMAGFTVGDLADARLSANVPLLATSNTFTASGSTTALAPIVLSAAEPDIVQESTGADVNEKITVIHTAAGRWRVLSRTDADGPGNDLLDATRSGTTWISLDLTATSITANGSTILTAATLDADLTTLAGLLPTANNFIVGNGSAWTLETPATARTSLGLGNAALVNEGSGNGLDADTVDGSHASAFAATGHVHPAGDITSGTLPLTRGGTGQTTIDNVAEQIFLQCTIAADPGGTPVGSPGDCFLYY